MRIIKAKQASVCLAIGCKDRTGWRVVYPYMRNSPCKLRVSSCLYQQQPVRQYLQEKPWKWLCLYGCRSKAYVRWCGTWPSLTGQPYSCRIWFWEGYWHWDTAPVRQTLASLQPTHPWTGISDVDFLKKVGAYATEYETGKEGFTLAVIRCMLQQRRPRMRNSLTWIWHAMRTGNEIRNMYQTNL